MPIPLADLPLPAVVETLDYEAIRGAMLAELQARMPSFTALVESDPALKILEAAAYTELLLRQRINEAARATMLAYAAGADLDQVAAATDTARLPGETDAALRGRAQSAWRALSVAGPTGAYRYWAGSVPGVADVAVTSPAAGDVTVKVLAATDDGVASAELLTAVRAALTSDTRRPVTDEVTVEAAGRVEYAVVAALTLEGAGPDAETVRAAAEAAVTALVAWRRIDVSMPRSRLFGALYQPGVRSVALTSPAGDVELPSGSAAICTDVTVTLA